MPTETFNRAVAAAIAKQIVRGTHKKLSRLHGDVLQELTMSFNRKGSTTTTGMTVGDTEDSRNPVPAQTSAMSESEATAAGVKPLAHAHEGTGINSGLNISVATTKIPVTIKHVDQKCIEGSYTGDTRKSGDTAKRSVNEIAGLGGPRTSMPGQRDSRNYNENGKSFRSFPGNAADEND